MAITVAEFKGTVRTFYVTTWGKKLTKLTEDVDSVEIQFTQYPNSNRNRTYYFEPVSLDRAFDEIQTQLKLSSSVFNKNPDNLSFWLLDGKYYLANDPELSLQDVQALLNVKSNQRRIQLEKAHALQAMVENLDGKRKRTGIPQNVRLEVWQRDGGRCVNCSSKENLEFDHIIPHSMGGADTTRNIQLLCESCNRRKGASFG